MSTTPAPVAAHTHSHTGAPLHTPGPWTLMEVSSTFKVCTADAEAFVKKNHYLAGAPFVAEINDDFGTDANHEDRSKYEPTRNPARVLANARLIAAAPDLLHHLRILAEEDSQCASDWVAKKVDARAAIARATQAPERARTEGHTP